MLRLDLNESVETSEDGHNYARETDYVATKAVLAHYVKTRPENLVITNGSYHALELIFSFLFKNGDQILLPVPTFPFYDKHEVTGKLRFIKISYQKNIVFSRRIAGLYLANPNNPTGDTLSRSQLRRIIAQAKKCGTLLIIDEAYFEFCEITAKSLVNKYSNLIVIRTLSKAFHLAGVRFGYIITNQKLAKKLELLKGPPYTISRLALKIGRNALSPAGQRKMKRRVKETKKTMLELERFFKKQGVRYFSSRANFFTIQVKNSKKIVAELARKQILTKDLNAYSDGDMTLRNCIRITAPPFAKLPLLKRELTKLL